MISLAGRDILHAWGKFVFTGVGLGLLIGVTLTMAGVYRGMVDDAKVLLDNSGADLWVVQRDTLGPYAESSSLHDDTWRSVAAMAGVARAANVTYLTMQVRQGQRDVRAMVVGVSPGGPGEPGQPGFLVAGRHLTRGHYEAVADAVTGFQHRYGVTGAHQFAGAGKTGNPGADNNDLHNTPLSNNPDGNNNPRPLGKAKASAALMLRPNEPLPGDKRRSLQYT